MGSSLSLRRLQRLRRGYRVIVATSCIPPGFDAITLWPFILVRPACRDDEALIAHELVHYREQAWIAPIWWLRYLLSKEFRLGAEVRAYRRQIAVGGITVERAAQLLLTYRLDITVERAIAELRASTASKPQGH